MALKVEIDENQALPINIITRSGKSQRTGRDWKMTTQKMWVYQPKAKHPIEINMNLPDGHQGYGGSASGAA